MFFPSYAWDCPATSLFLHTCGHGSIHSAPSLTKSSTACPPPALSSPKSILLDCISWRQTHIVRVSLNIPWIWFLPLVNPLFSRCWDQSMAAVCLGKMICQKWAAHLHVHSVRACMHYHHHSRSWSNPGLTTMTALFGQLSSATMFKSFRGHVHPNAVNQKLTTHPRKI